VAGLRFRPHICGELESMALGEHDREVLRLIKGSPEPQPSAAELARLVGEDERTMRARLERLIAEGRLQRDGTRLIAVDDALDDAEPDEEIP
jgi:predicted transcriptional regulator